MTDDIKPDRPNVRDPLRGTPEDRAARASGTSHTRMKAVQEQQQSAPAVSSPEDRALAHKFVAAAGLTLLCGFIGGAVVNGPDHVTLLPPESLNHLDTEFGTVMQHVVRAFFEHAKDLYVEGGAAAGALISKLLLFRGNSEERGNSR